MSKRELLSRYVLFFMGLFIVSLGISFITKTGLGTSPISSIPYVLSLGFDLTLGNFTILFSILLVILQIILLGRNFKPISLLQVVVSIVFGYFIDLTMLFLGWLVPSNYVMKIICLLIGCCILAFGVYLEVVANVIMLPGEAFSKAVSDRFHTEFGPTKVCCDVSMVVIAIIISLVLFHRLEGVREGTIISAAICGFIVKFYGKLFDGIMKKYL